MKQLSVIIPCYNKEKYLSECLDSIINQTYKDIDIIIVDDCSSDASYDIAVQYSQKYENITVIRNSKNSGVSSTRNNGAQQARTKYISFLDADDYYYNESKLKNEIALISQYGTNIIAFSNIAIVNDTGVKTGEIVFAEKISGHKLFLRNILSLKSMLLRDYIFRKEDFINAGSYRDGYSLFEDFDLLLNLCEGHNFFNTGSIGTAYRQVNSGLSDKSQDVLLKARKEIIEYHIENESFLKKYFYICAIKCIDFTKKIINYNKRTKNHEKG